MKDIQAAQPALDQPYTIAEFARTAKISESSARKLIRQKAISVVKLGRLVRIPRHEIARVLGAN